MENALGYPHASGVYIRAGAPSQRGKRHAPGTRSPEREGHAPSARVRQNRERHEADPAALGAHTKKYLPGELARGPCPRAARCPAPLAQRGAPQGAACYLQRVRGGTGLRGRRGLRRALHHEPWDEAFPPRPAPPSGPPRRSRPCKAGRAVLKKTQQALAIMATQSRGSGGCERLRWSRYSGRGRRRHSELSSTDRSDTTLRTTGPRSRSMPPRDT